MRTQITARHFQASEHLQEYVHTKVDKLKKFYDGITDVLVTLTKTTNTPENIAEISLTVFRQKLHAEAEGVSMEEAVDLCVERLRRQILKYKSKLRDTKVDQYR